MRYLLRFYKKDSMIYISHLDMLRFFKRVFKRTGIRLQHSQGYNPHPKMSFAQPLSLGYSGMGEYLEFETINAYPAETLKTTLHSVLPRGLGITDCWQIPQGSKTMAAMVSAGSYLITIAKKSRQAPTIDRLIADFLAQDRIVVKKLQRKTNKETEVDIRPMIFLLLGKDDNNKMELTAIISAGSTANLSPEYLISAFCSFAKIDYDRAEVQVCRTELYGERNGKRTPLSMLSELNID